MGSELEEGRSDDSLFAFDGIGTDEKELVAVAEEVLRAFCQLQIRGVGVLPPFVTVIAHGITQVGQLANNLLFLPIL